MPYEYFLTRNSSDLTKDAITEVQQVVSGVYIPLLQGAGRVFLAFLIVILLIIIDPLLAIVVGSSVAGSYALIYKLFKSKITRMAKLRTSANQRRVRLVSEAGGGIKDIKLMNKELTYLKDFNIPSKEYAISQANSTVIGVLPKYFLEIIAFGGVLSITIYLIATRLHYSEAIALTSLYAFAGYKLMPALQEIFSSVTKIRFALPALEGVYQNTENNVFWPIQRQDKPISFEKEIILNNVSFSYAGAKSNVLKNVSLVIKANTSVGIIGPTGSGKTTLIDILLGLLRPKTGEILIDGQKLTEKNLSAWQANIGYVPQSIYLTDDTIAANIAFGISPKERDIRSIRRAAQQAQIADFVEKELSNGYKTVVGERGVRLSGGQRQRIGIARALYHDPNFLVFDEATSALDEKTEEEVMKAIECLLGRKTIIMIAHRESTLRCCDKIIKIEKGLLNNSKLENNYNLKKENNCQYEN